MLRFLTRFAWISLVVPASCEMAACVDDPSIDEPAVSETESAISYPFCVDHPCADLTVRVLEDNYYPVTTTYKHSCSAAGTGVLISNRGDLNAAQSTVKITTPGTGVTKTFTIPAIPAHFSYLLAVTVPRESSVYVDVNDVVMESNENWNYYHYYCL